MARGSAPKDPRTRARRNKDERPFSFVEVERVPQPDLPDDIEIGQDDLGVPVYKEWPAVTRRWWARWGRSPMSATFTEDDWDELLMAAFLHADFWQTGDVRKATELRNRTAKFGATPEDRARLRVQYVVADDAERKSNERRQAEARKAHEERSSAREKYGPLRVVE